VAAEGAYLIGVAEEAWEVQLLVAGKVVELQLRVSSGLLPGTPPEVGSSTICYIFHY
jgi:hypothetical protein